VTIKRHFKTVHERDIRHWMTEKMNNAAKEIAFKAKREAEAADKKTQEKGDQEKTVSD
jgi:hypothetical protein